MPANTYSLTDVANWVTVNAQYDVNTDTTPGDPQYLIQFMGTGTGDSNFGLDANAGHGHYSEPESGSTTVAYYRITARSSAPADVGDRSIVVLQSTVKRAI
jgi:type IV pilus assembly protein PilX